ncbi:MAG: TetR/AcrR family transcriptional regulator [Clostridia bacterium]|nr:TetR/AcrR family transcriptional regulator [Clostridia bacterium]
MKKGDLRRDSILETAERLFFEKGYDQTSIQDILDELSLSKGGFYHHFQSKEAILSEICEKRVTNSLSELKMELSVMKASPIEKLNLLLRKVNLFDRDDTAFVAVLLKVCYVDGDVRIRDRIRSVVNDQLTGYVNGVIEEGMQTGDFFVRNPGQIGAIILGMTANVDDSACRILAADPDNPDCIIEIAEQLNACRDAVETLLGAPFSTIYLFDPAKLVSDYRAAAAELMRLEGK